MKNKIIRNRGSFKFFVRNCTVIILSITLPIVPNIDVTLNVCKHYYHIHDSMMIVNVYINVLCLALIYLFIYYSAYWKAKKYQYHELQPKRAFIHGVGCKLSVEL